MFNESIGVKNNDQLNGGDGQLNRKNNDPNDIDDKFKS